MFLVTFRPPWVVLDPGLDRTPILLGLRIRIYVFYRCVLAEGLDASHEACKLILEA
jgi:hypothetical protein